MDDTLIKDDPRKQSAKQIKIRGPIKKKRGFFGFIGDWIVKSILMTVILAIDFTLFLNSGNYSIFSGYGDINMEAMFIYAGIAALSFGLMLLCMIILPLENLLLSCVFAVTGVAIINQFATFDKQSGLIILFGKWLSNDVNALLYEYSLWIIMAAIFLLTYIILKILGRSGTFYLTLLFMGLGAWIVSESYFSPSKPLFRQVADNGSADKKGNNLVFITLKNATSPNILHNLAQQKNHPEIAQKAFDVALATFSQNNFVIYPNAMIENSTNNFKNLSEFYNPDNSGSNEMSVVTQDGYFDFNMLHPKTEYLDKSSLFSLLKKQGYSLNVFQSEGIDVCHMGGDNSINSCYEKVNYPVVLPSDKVTTSDRIGLLVSQWLVSTGMINDINPVLEVLRYVVDLVKPYNFAVNKIQMINSFNVLDMVISDMQRKEGGQAYFVTMDLPEKTFVYDEFCKLKPIRQWLNNQSQVSSTTKQQLYLEQSVCMYGQLNKFIQQLKDEELFDKTTIIVAGLSTSDVFRNPTDSDFYRQTQEKQQSGLAIKPLKSNKYMFDYRVCSTREFLDSYFFNKKGCREFGFVKTTNQNIERMKKMVRDDMFNDKTIASANNSFNKWFRRWSDLNNYDIDDNLKSVAKPNDNEDVIEETNIAPTAELPIEQEVQENMKTPENLYEQSENNQQAAEVIPSTLFDNGVEVEETPKVEDGLKTEEEIPVVEDMANDKIIEVPVEVDNVVFREEAAVYEESQSQAEVIQKNVNNVRPVEENNPKLGYDLNETINNAKLKAKENAQKIKEEAERQAEAARIAQAQKESADREMQQKAQQYKDVLFAPVDSNSKMSPEELKRQYHEMLKQMNVTSGNTVKIEIVE